MYKMRERKEEQANQDDLEYCIARGLIGPIFKIINYVQV